MVRMQTHLENLSYKNHHGPHLKMFRYKKVGVNLTGLIPQEFVQGNLFENTTLYDKRLMHVIDTLNHKFGKATVGSALVGTRVEQWELVKKDRSNRYTTQWHELLELKNK